MNCITAARFLPGLLLSVAIPLHAQVTLNEINAAPNERALRWDAAGQPRLSTGPAWFDTSFDASAWATGAAPLGFNAGNAGLGTNLRTQLDGLTSSLYVRKVFTVSAGNAASTENLRLCIDYNDGYIAFLNGREVARARLGAAKGFVFADQPAFSSRPAAPAGPLDVNLGAANQFLVAGDNVLAIQVANASVDGKGDLRIDAGLELNNGILTTTEFSENFNNANGASRTHTNTAGSITNTTTGTPPPGWLTNAANPFSDAAWSALTIDQLLETTGGTGNSGVLRINMTGTGPTQPARVYGPPVNMAAQWTAGAVTEADLTATTLNFKFKAPAGYSANVKLEPVGGAPGDALSLGTLAGSTVLPTADVLSWWRFEDHLVSGNPVAGANGATIANAPSVVNNAIAQASLVTANAAKYSNDVAGAKILDPITGAVYSNTFSFDATLANARFSAANNALYNTTSFTVEMFIKLTGEPTGFDNFIRRLVDGPNADSATASDRHAWQIDYDHGTARTNYGKVRSRWDTAGISPAPLDNNRVAAGNYLLVDTPSGDGNFNSYSAAADVYTDGDQYNDTASNVWHHVAITFDGPSKRVTIYTDYVAGGTFVLNNAWTHPAGNIDFGKFSGTAMPAPASTAWPLKMDEIRYSGRVLLPSEMLKVAAPDAAGFTTVTVSPGSAAAAQRTAFLTALNNAGSQSFRPVFELVDASYATVPGKDMRLEDFSVTYARQSPITPLFGLGSTMQYFPGAGEPSGGVWEPNLPKVPNNRSEPALPPPFPDLPGFADWIELRNSSAAPVDLTGWSLSDESGTLTKWMFPAGTTIPANGHLLVLCDENAHLTGQVYLHTNFKLSEGGETIYLSQNGSLVDSLSYPRVDPFHTYGRSAVDGTPGYFDLATPAAANGATLTAERCRTPDFFADAAFTLPKEGGFYTGAQDLYMQTLTPGAEIRYTTDGSEPTATSALYPAPGPLSVAPGANDKTGRVIRARAFKAGTVASNTKTITLLINQNTSLKTVPALIFTGDGARNFYKDHGVMANNGGTYLPDGTTPNQIWSAPAVTDYSMGVMHGRPFERPLHLEWFPVDGSAGFSEAAGIRIASSPYSRPRLKLTQTSASPWSANATEKPSFNLFFREDYDQGELNYPFFGRDYPVKSFDELRPRAGKNDISNPFIKDELVRRVFGDMGHKSVRGQINTLYVNGIYKGFFNTVERYREPYFQRHFDSNNAWDIRINDVVEEGDGAEWDALIAAAERPLGVRANWDDVANRAALDEMIDYWLLNIYMSMWDWPNNNWIASREKVAGGKWRLHIWDGEGSFGHGNVKPPWYDTIATDFKATTGTGSSQQSRLWRGLYTSPEFKLRFADRIHHWFFNGNVLDDRVNTNCIIQQRMKELADPFRPLLLYTHGGTLADPPAFWTNWTTTTNWTWAVSGVNRTASLPPRRTLLFGPVSYTYTPAGGSPTNVNTDISFRFHGFWPATEPVTFSQHGGVVQQGFSLGLTANATVPAGSTIYYTTDGTDPREWGGTAIATASTFTTTASPETFSFALPGTLYTTVKARVKNGTTNEWSALTEATFQFASVAATASNLVVNQIMYNPPDTTAAETLAGYTDKDEFEYLELMAIGPDPVSLDNVQFVAGCVFDFGTTTVQSPIRALAPGDTVLLVKNKAAFRLRYGTTLDARIAGEFVGNLSNNGERLWITGPDGADAGTDADTIRDFSYDDDTAAGWPFAADGSGSALKLVAPAINPDHALPASWTATLQWGGTPAFFTAPLTYANWLPAHFSAAERADALISGPDADPDGDGLSNLVEFMLATIPDRSTSGLLTSLPVYSIAPGPDTLDHLHATWTVSTQALAGATLTAETGSDLTGWTPLTAVSTTPNANGTTTLVFRDPAQWLAAARKFARFRITVN